MAKKINYKIANIQLSKIVSLLGKILGIVVKEQEGSVLYNKIEEIRSLSKASRGTKSKKKIKLNETRKFRQLISTINKLKPKESLVIARSFSKFLNFSKILFTLVYFCISVLLFTSVGCAVKTKSTLSDLAT